jgi:hypothetical protein
MAKPKNKVSKLESYKEPRDRIEAMLRMAEECLAAKNMTMTIGERCDAEIDLLFKGKDTEDVIDIDNIDVFFTVGIVVGMRLAGASEEEVRKAGAVLRIDY